MSEVHIIYSLLGNAEEAESICKVLLAEKLIACANRLAPAISHYEWDGEICESSEYPVIFKTSAAKVDAALARIADLHSYDTPTILSWAADKAHAPFADWIIDQTA